MGGIGGAGVGGDWIFGGVGEEEVGGWVGCMDICRWSFVVPGSGLYRD